MRLVAVGLALVVCACTKQNPSACGDGVCNDPALPFCDTQGTLGGAVNECIAVSCTPGEFAECRGDVSVVCNETGDNYDLIECVRGCDDATGGCHIDPSNDLGQYYDMVPEPPDLVVTTGTIDTFTGEVNGSATTPSFLVAAPAGVAHRSASSWRSVFAWETSTSLAPIHNALALRRWRSWQPRTSRSKAAWL